MAHLLAPQPSAPGLPVIYNVDGVVGANPSQNLREDVLFVQFCMKVVGDKPLAKTDPLYAAACKLVKLTGVIDPATVNAIKVRQEVAKKKNQAPGTVVDGRVSPAKGAYAYGAGFWTIVELNNDLQGRNLDVWPRVDKIAGCPAELKAMVVRTLVGT